MPRTVLHPRAWFLPASLVLPILILSSVSVRTQESVETHIGLVQDWSTHHAVFPRMGHIQTLMAARRDPRSFQAWQRTMLALRRGGPIIHGRRVPDAALTDVREDWSVSLGAAGTDAGMSPAKFSFDVNATPSCAADFVVFPVDQSPNSSNENLAAFNNLYSGTTPANGICNRTPSGSDAGTSATVMWIVGDISDGYVALPRCKLPHCRLKPDLLA
jgi:hypothetical protein